jgi:transposase
MPPLDQVQFDERGIEQLFSKVLHLPEPRYVAKVEFLQAIKTIKIHIDFKKWYKFHDEETQQDYTAYQTTELEYRHMNFFEFKTIMIIRTPKIKTLANGKSVIKTIHCPIAREWSKMTLWMESYVLTIVKFGMPVVKVAELLDISDKTVRKTIITYVSSGREQADMSNVTRLGIDETSRKKWHNYITPFVDLEKKDVLFIADWKWADTIDQFMPDFLAHGGDPENVTEVSSDLSPSFTKWVRERLKNAKIVYDKFHVIKLFGENIDDIRKAESRWSKDLKKSKLLLLKNQDSLEEKGRKRLDEILWNNKSLLEVYNYKIQMQKIYMLGDIKSAEVAMMTMIEEMAVSTISCVVRLGNTLKNHLQWILNYRVNRTTNWIMEWLNSVIQTVKRIAKWFRNVEYFKAMIYLKIWRLDLSCINSLLALPI